MQTERIPLTVGVTGHRAIQPQDVPALTVGVKRELEQLQLRGNTVTLPIKPYEIVTIKAE